MSVISQYYQGVVATTSDVFWCQELVKRVSCREPSSPRLDVIQFPSLSREILTLISFSLPSEFVCVSFLLKVFLCCQQTSNKKAIGRLFYNTTCFTVCFERWYILVGHGTHSQKQKAHKQGDKGKSQHYKLPYGGWHWEENTMLECILHVQ